MVKRELQSLIEEQKILNRIYVVRGQKVMLDRDLAEAQRVCTHSQRNFIAVIPIGKRSEE